jgi:hypothetical protein
MRRKLTKPILAGALAATLFLPATPALAGKRGRKNTALAVTGVAAYHLLKGHTFEALGFGAGSFFAWKKVKNKRARVF